MGIFKLISMQVLISVGSVSRNSDSEKADTMAQAMIRMDGKKNPKLL